MWQMLLKELMKEAGFSQYRLAVESGVPHATLSGLLTGKTKIERCESGTLYKLTKTLGVSMEILVEDGIRRTEREKSYEYGLPGYLQHDLDFTNCYVCFFLALFLDILQKLSFAGGRWALSQAEAV